MPFVTEKEFQSSCWLHDSPLFKCPKCKLVHCKFDKYYPCFKEDKENKDNKTDD